MLRVSEFSSLNFHSDWKGRTNIDIDYHQRFLLFDEIKVQFICDPVTYSRLSIILYGRTNKSEITLTPVDLTPNLDYRTGQVILPAIIPGEYELSLQASGSPIASSLFCITDYFPDSVLIKYTNYRTEFDTIFSDMFSFRVEGIFLPSDVNFEVSTEDFRDQRYSPAMLSAFPYEKHTFTVGLGQGVPNWVGRKLNHIFSLSEIYIDRQMYVRSEGSAPQKTAISQDSPLFIWKIEVEPKDEVLEVIDSFRTIPESPLMFDGRSGSQKISVITTLEILSVSSIHDWITITKISDSQYTISVPDSTTNRAGKIEIQTSGGDYEMVVNQYYQIEVFADIDNYYLVDELNNTLSFITTNI